MDMILFREEILQLIAFWQEGKYWDFKKEWHKNMPDTSTLVENAK